MQRATDRQMRHQRSYWRREEEEAVRLTDGVNKVCHSSKGSWSSQTGRVSSQSWTKRSSDCFMNNSSFLSLIWLQLLNMTTIMKLKLRTPVFLFHVMRKVLLHTWQDPFCRAKCLTFNIYPTLKWLQWNNSNTCSLLVKNQKFRRLFSAPQLIFANNMFLGVLSQTPEWNLNESTSFLLHESNLCSDLKLHS